MDPQRPSRPRATRDDQMCGSSPEIKEGVERPRAQPLLPARACSFKRQLQRRTLEALMNNR